jgi:hypothetical protein
MKPALRLTNPHSATTHYEPVADERAAVAYLDLGTGGYMDVGTNLTDEQLAALPKGRHMLAIIGTHGVNGYTPASAPVAGEPFMYGIMGPDGKAHFEEFCVSGDRSELQTEVVDHLNRDNPEGGTYSVVALFRDAAPQASAEAFDFVAHLARQAEFSARTFGPGARVAGVCDHIRKELIEVETSGGDLKEWVDVIILGLDGAWRSGVTPQEIIAAIVAKQAKNEARTWPDWRTVDPTKAIEHDRGGQP